METDSIKYKSITDENGIPQFEFETVQDARWINTHICKPDGISYVHKDVCTDWSFFSREGIRLLPSMAAMDLNSGVQYRIDRLAEENRCAMLVISQTRTGFVTKVIAPSDISIDYGFCNSCRTSYRDQLNAPADIDPRILDVQVTN